MRKAFYHDFRGLTSESYVQFQLWYRRWQSWNRLKMPIWYELQLAEYLKSLRMILFRWKFLWIGKKLPQAVLRKNKFGHAKRQMRRPPSSPPYPPPSPPLPRSPHTFSFSLPSTSPPPQKPKSRVFANSKQKRYGRTYGRARPSFKDAWTHLKSLFIFHISF